MNGHISFCGAFEAKCFMGAVENIFEQKYLSLREGLLIPDIILCVCVLSGPHTRHTRDNMLPLQGHGTLDITF